ncbi:MAG TPA: VOC family protein [Acidimicrobiales bacterium]|nr:VOC family protein [Acidimicrobiales bacterium]
MSVFRAGGVSYLRIPAPDPPALARFYGQVFGWAIDLDRADPSFQDGSGHVIGHFRGDRPVAGAAGFIPYVYVADLDRVAESATASGATITTERYREGDLWVAVISDPAGNQVGIWQKGDGG